MAVKKSELYSKLWASCDELRGGMDASQYKDYILTLLFVKYVSDKFKGQPFADIEIPAGASFDDMVALKRDAHLGEEMDKIIGKLAEVNNLRNVIDNAKFNDEEKMGRGDEKKDRLSNLIDIFNDPALNFKDNKTDGDDIIGDAYEYLMKNFAKDSGKSKGQFYTPAEVSRILAKIIGIKNAKRSDTLYDCACGSGSLLIKAANECDNKVTIYGQEKDGATAGMAKMNMVLHNLSTATIHKDNTMAAPFFKEKDKHGNDIDNKLKQFNYIVANPPFSLKNWKNGVDIEKYGIYQGFSIPPEKCGDYAWLLHCIKSLKQTGTGAIILPHGVLFRGNAEADIRKEIIDRGLIKAIIGLPSNLFYGTGIPACIIVFDKKDAAERQGIFMIDASKGFVKDGPKNRLREQDIKKIIDAFDAQLEIPKFSRFVPNKEIKKDNKYNLNLPRYINTTEEEDLQDIDAHLHGGIPMRDVDSMQKYWEEFPNLKKKLFSKLRDRYYKLNIDKDDVRSAIYADEQFSGYAQNIDNAFKDWKIFADKKLNALDENVKPKELIIELSQELLNKFEGVELVDKYDVYEVLLEYWQEVMQDDTSLICTKNGWNEAKDIELEYSKQKKEKDGEKQKTKKEPKPTGWHGKIISKELLASIYYPDQVLAIEKLNNAISEQEGMLESLLEENGGEDSVFNECINDKNEITAKLVEEKYKEMKETNQTDEDFVLLEKYVKIKNVIKQANKDLKVLSLGLNRAVGGKYSELTTKEIKDILINKKWLKAVYEGIDNLYTAISHNIANRIVELVERYENTLLDLETKVNSYEVKVKGHLEKMGYRL